MGRKEDLISSIADDLEGRVGTGLDHSLLRAIIDNSGPAVFGAGELYVNPDNAEDLKRVRLNFLGKRLALRDSDQLKSAVEEAVATYGQLNEGQKIPKPALYYLLVVQLGRQDAFGL